MRVFRLWVGTLLGAVLTFSALARPAAAEPMLLRPLLSGTHDVADMPLFQLNPDGSRVVYAGGLDDQPRRLFSAPTDGSAAPAAFTASSAFGRVGGFKISPDGSRVVYLYESSPASDQLELYSAPLAGGASIKLSGPLPANAAIEGFMISPDSARVVYRADVFADQQYELFTVPTAGGALLRINKPPVAGGSVDEAFQFSPDSSHVVYTAELDTTLRAELYASRLDMSGSQRLSEPLNGFAAVRSFKITPHNMVLYTADPVLSGRIELFSVPLFDPQIVASGQATAAIGGVTKLNGPLANGASVVFYQYSLPARQVVFRTQAEGDAQQNLYAVGVQGGPVTRLNEALVANGNIDGDFLISPDGRWVVYRADQQVDEVDELFAAPLAGGASLRLNPGLVEDGDVKQFAISPDSSRVVYLANQQELYSTALPAASDTPQTPMLTHAKLNAPLVLNGAVATFAISPAGDRVVYRADQETSDVHELYSVPLAGGEVAKLNEELVAGGDVLGYQFSADGSRVVYRADQATDETFALFAAYEPAPSATIAGPAGPLPVGAHAAKLTLSQPLQLASVHVKVDTAGGDAVPGTDFLLPAKSAPQAAGTPKGEVVVVFAPGEKSKALPVQVLANAERTEPRTLRLSIIGTAGGTPGNPAGVDLTLATYEAPGSPPSSPPGSPGAPPAVPPGTHRTLLPLAQR